MINLFINLHYINIFFYILKEKILYTPNFIEKINNTLLI